MGLVTVLAVASSTSIIAQEQALQPGQRVRVTVPSLDLSKHQDTFQRVAGDTLVLSSAGYALPDVTRFDVYAGRKSHLWLGAGIGLLAGAITGAVTWTSIGDCGFVDDSECRFYGSLLFGGVGAVAGGVVGLLIKTDRWEEVPLDRLRLSIAPTRNGLGIGARIAF